MRETTFRIASPEKDDVAVPNMYNPNCCNWVGTLSYRAMVKSLFQMDETIKLQSPLYFLDRYFARNLILGFKSFA